MKKFLSLSVHHQLYFLWSQEKKKYGDRKMKIISEILTFLNLKPHEEFGFICLKITKLLAKNEVMYLQDAQNLLTMLLLMLENGKLMKR